MSMMRTNSHKNLNFRRLVNFFRASSVYGFSKILFFCFASFLFGCEAQKPRTVFSFTHINVIDWSISTLYDDMLVVFSDDQIYWVTPMNSLMVSEHTENIDMSGKYISAGMSDCSIKLSGHPLDSTSLKPLLKRGITTCVINDATNSDIIRYINGYAHYQFSMPDCYFTVKQEHVDALLKHEKLAQVNDSFLLCHLLVKQASSNSDSSNYSWLNSKSLTYVSSSSTAIPRIYYTSLDSNQISLTEEVWGSGYAVSQDNTYGDTLSHLFLRLSRKSIQDLNQYLFNSVRLFKDTHGYSSILKDQMIANVVVFDRNPLLDFQNLENPMAVVNSGRLIWPLKP